MHVCTGETLITPAPSPCCSPPHQGSSYSGPQRGDNEGTKATSERHLVKQSQLPENQSPRNSREDKRKPRGLRANDSPEPLGQRRETEGEAGRWSCVILQFRAEAGYRAALPLLGRDSEGMVTSTDTHMSLVGRGAVAGPSWPQLMWLCLTARKTCFLGGEGPCVLVRPGAAWNPTARPAWPSRLAF